MSIPREGSRHAPEGMVISISPDVCLTPRGPVKVPVPYSLVAHQKDHANTAATVRQNGHRTHTMGSLITVSYGDEPGTGGGVKSGTVQSICHPLEHSRTVRAEGKNVIRHRDLWEMNNRNTVGRLIYVKNVEIPEPVPEVKQRQEEQAQNEPETTGSPNTQSPSQGETLADFDQGNTFEPNRDYAFLNTTTSTSPPPVNWRPPPPVLPPRVPQGPRVGPTVDPSLPIPNTSFFQDYRPIGDSFITDLEGPLSYVKQLPGGWFQLRDPNSPLGIRLVNQDELERLYAEAKLERERKRRAAVPLPTSETVRTTDEKKRDCRVGKYKDIQGTCPAGEQAHHIVPDYTLRYGTRAEGAAGRNRIPGMPSFGDGAAICLIGGAKDDGSEHWEAHGADALIEGLGAGNNYYPKGTAPIGDIIREAKIQTMFARPECADKIQDETNKAFSGVNKFALGRTTQKLPTGDALESLKSGMTATRH